MKQASVRIRQGAKRLEQVEGAHDVGGDKRLRAVDAPVHVALGGEVHDQLGIDTSKEGMHGSLAGDVHPFEGVVRAAGDSCDAAEVGRVGQRVDVDEVVLRMPGHQKIEEVSTDEAGSAGNDNPHEWRLDSWLES